MQTGMQAGAKDELHQELEQPMGQNTESASEQATAPGSESTTEPIAEVKPNLMPSIKFVKEDKAVFATNGANLRSEPWRAVSISTPFRAR